MVEQKMEVLIIGAGTTGLLIAQGLKKANIPFQIFEREESDTSVKRSRDWGMALHWGSHHFASCLPEDILSRMPTAIHVDPFYEGEYGQMPDLKFVDCQTGDILTSIPCTELWRVSRKKMRRVFSEGVNIQYGKRLDSIEINSTSVTAKFSDSTSVSGTHLVGADGAKSILRTILLGSKAPLTALPVVQFNFKCSFTSAQARFLKETPAFHPMMNFGINSELRMLALLASLDISNKNDPATWMFQFYLSHIIEDYAPVLAMTNKEKLAFLRRGVEKWVDPFKSALLWLKEDINIPTDLCTFWKEPEEWNNYAGKVALAGDAVHPMTPHRGQGLNNAIQDAANLVHTLINIKNGEDAEEAMTAYEAETLERGKKEIAISYASTLASHDAQAFKGGPVPKLSLRQEELAVNDPF